MEMFSWARTSPLEVRLRIDPNQRIYIISDLHLGDGTRSDSFLGKDREMVRFLDRVRDEGAHLVIAGDCVDFHQAFSMSRVLKAHAKLMGELSRLAQTTGVTYLWGNHDYDISLFKDLLRFEVCSSLQIGEDVLVEHGYQYDPHIGSDLEGTHLHTLVHHGVERLLGSWIRLPIEEFYTWPTRVSFWLFHKWAMVVHALDQVARRLDQPDLLKASKTMIAYWTQNQVGDAAMLYEGVRAFLPGSPYRYLVTGHSHLPGIIDMAPGKTFVNTGSWTFNSAQYAVWEGDKGPAGQVFRVKDWITGKEYDDRNFRILADGRYAHMDFREWWRENYLGWLRFRVAEEGRLPALLSERPEAVERAG